MRARFLICTLLSAALGLSPGLSAHAQDVTAGHRLAAAWCAGCHEVEKTVRGPISDAVPSFISIAKMPSATQTSLTVFLMTPHPSMPNYTLSRKEISDVIAYILSLREDESLPSNATIRLAPSR